jgi:hypothetical protein
MNVYRMIVAMAALFMLSCNSPSKPSSSPGSSEKSMMARETAGGFYAEETHKGRLYVFGTEKAHQAFSESQQVPHINKAFIGAGLEGQTVVLEADPKSNDLQDRLKSQYEARHGAKLQ